MITEGTYEIAQITGIARDVYQMRLLGDTSAFDRPGQFVQIKLPGLYLRRPISVCTYGKGELTLLFKVVGKGTAQMAAMQPGQSLSMLCGLGNGFDAEKALGKRIALVGGGVGLPPLYGLMETLRGENVQVVMGFASASDVFYVEAFEALGAPVTVTTADGTRGIRGFVTDALRDMPYDYYFTCGPEPMLRAIHALGKEGQLSFEARMGCGFGACMGCSCRTITGSKRICLEGPVMESQEVMF